MRTLFVITYEASTGGGHGEGSYTVPALWIEAGAFTTREEAERWLSTAARPYGANFPTVTPIEVRG